MKNTRIKLFFPILLFVFVASWTYAQDDARVLLQNLEEEDIKNIDALAMYPEDTRIAIFEACLHPELLIKIKKVQSKTVEDFTSLMKSYPQKTQQEIWDLTRYPNLIERLVTQGKPNSTEVKQILKEYPKAIHSRAESCIRNHFPILQKVNELNQTSQTAFDYIITSYDEQTQNALKKLIELPEVMSIMTDNIEVTILVGDAYKNYPEWVLQKADSLHMELARQNTKELEDWKKRVEENPELATDLQASAEEFAKENNYDDLYYDTKEYDYPEDDLYYEEESQQKVIERHYYYNYPYWYGYPTWYEYPRWRPYPYWYDWGFHFRPGGRVVIVHMPSYFFVDWYFYRPHHHHNYPHLSAHFVDHYYGHRHSVGGITTSVRIWREKNKAVITDDMIVNAPRKINAYREYGLMEEARMKYNKSNPKKRMTQEQFVEKNKKSYPRLRKEVQQREEFSSKGQPRAEEEIIESKPRNKFPSRSKKETQKKNTPRNLPKTSKKKKIKSTQKAKDVHQRTWNKSKRSTSKKSKLKTKKTTPRKKTKQN